MRCFRCQGTMARIKFYGPGDPFWGWKCFSCGDILDPVILENRHESLQIPSIERKGIPKGIPRKEGIRWSPGKERGLKAI